MENSKNAADIWDYIESHHKPQGIKYGSSYSMTLENGITYLYQVLPDGRLLTIEDWFEGYVDILGNIESGIHYAIIFDKCKVLIHEYINGMRKTEPTVTLKYTKKEIDEIKAIIKTCPPIRLRWQYHINDQCYWVIDSYNSQTFIYNITQKSVSEKYIRTNDDSYDDYIIIYRFSFAPYRYGIVSNWLPLDPYSSNELFIMDFESKNKIRIGVCTRQKFLRIIEFKNYEYYIIMNGVGSSRRSIKYEPATNNLFVWPYDLVEPAQYFNKNSKLKIKRTRSNSCPYACELNDTVNIINDSYPYNNVLEENCHFVKTISHIRSNDKMDILLSQEFVDLLEESLKQNDYVKINGKIYISELSSICEASDRNRLTAFLDYVDSKIQLTNYVLNQSHLVIEILTHSLTSGNSVTQKVRGNLFYNRELDKCEWTKVDKLYKENCQFDLSIKISLDFDSDEYKIIYEDSDDVVDLSEISLDTMFEEIDDEEEDSLSEESEESKNDYIYRYIVYDKEYHK